MTAPPPNHQRQSVDLPLFQGMKVCIEKAVINRENLCKLLIEHGACIADEPEEDAVHVMEAFCGEVFEELRRRGVRIVGTPCIFDSIRRGKPLPESKFPIYSRVLEGLCITTTGFNSRKKSDVETLVRFMSGIYAPDLTNRTDYLVASEVGSEKYFVACQRSIPIVRPDWLLACWKECALLTPHESLLSPLAGLTICVTGLSATSRSLVQRLVSQHGGRYSPDLTRKCTHLLAYTCEGNKFHYATFWGIPVVRPEWLAECINVGIYVDPRAFLLSPNSPMPPQVAALNLPELPTLPAPLTNSRARAHTLSTLSRSHSTTALDVISDVQPEMPRAPPASTNSNKRLAPSRAPITTWTSDHLSAMLADCNAAVDSLLTVATVCNLLQRADPRAHTALWHACVTFAAEHLDELETTPAFQALPVEARKCVLRARTPNAEKRRRVEDE